VRKSHPHRRVHLQPFGVGGHYPRDFFALAADLQVAAQKSGAVYNSIFPSTRPGRQTVRSPTPSTSSCGPIVSATLTRMGERKVRWPRRDELSKEREDRSKIVRGREIRQAGATSKGGSGARFACPATLFACGAGDGNRTRIVSLGRVLIPP